MYLQDLTLALFAMCNGLRVLAYVPQIHKAATDSNGASAISSSTWSMFLVTHLATIAYAIVNQSDWWLATCFTANATGSAAILVAAWWRGRQHMRRLSSYSHRTTAPECSTSLPGGIDPSQALVSPHGVK